MPARSAEQPSQISNLTAVGDGIPGHLAHGKGASNWRVGRLSNSVLWVIAHAKFSVPAINAPELGKVL